MTTWNDRLQEALTARGKDWPDLVAATGRKKPSVYAWKPTATKRTNMMDGDNVAKVCAFLGINSKWLFYGIGPSGLDTAEAVDPTTLHPPANGGAHHAAEPTADAYHIHIHGDERLLLDGFRVAGPDLRAIMLDIARRALSRP